MTDDRELAGLDPYDIFDEEAARVDRFYRDAPDDVLSRPSRCEGWSVRDVLGHLAATEEYHHACLEGTVASLVTAYAERGATDIASSNELGIAQYRDRSRDEVLAQWRADNEVTRRGFRARGDGMVDTSIGDYPCRWQAFHLAGELATHADDAGVPIEDEERERRRAWRARFSRFALAEAKPELTIEVVGDRTVVDDGTVRVEVDDDELIEGVAGRLDETSRLAAAERTMLSTMP